MDAAQLDARLTLAKTSAAIAAHIRTLYMEHERKRTHARAPAADAGAGATAAGAGAETDDAGAPATGQSAGSGPANAPKPQPGAVLPRVEGCKPMEDEPMYEAGPGE